MLAGDGFMCNMLTVTQMLNQKVKVEKVDPFYPFLPAGRTPKLTDETRLNMTSADAESWVAKGLPALVPPNWRQVYLIAGVASLDFGSDFVYAFVHSFIHSLIHSKVGVIHSLSDSFSSHPKELLLHRPKNLFLPMRTRSISLNLPPTPTLPA